MVAIWLAVGGIAAAASQVLPVWDQASGIRSSAGFKAAYPDKLAEVLPGCPVVVWAGFSGDGMKWLRLNQARLTPGCRDRLVAAMDAALGPALARNGNAPTAMGFARGYTYREWHRPGLLVTMRAPGGADGNFTMGFFRR